MALPLASFVDGAEFFLCIHASERATCSQIDSVVSHYSNHDPMRCQGLPCVAGILFSTMKAIDIVNLVHTLRGTSRETILSVIHYCNVQCLTLNRVRYPIFVITDRLLELPS